MLEGARAALAALPAGVASVAAELAGNLAARAPDYLPWFAFYCALHALAEFGVPLVFPGAYDALDRKRLRKLLEARGERAPVDRARVARHARTAIVSVVMALHVTGASLYTLWASPAYRALGADFYGETPLTRHLTSVAVGFFLWDCAICAADALGAEFAFHGVACLCVFAGALRPFLQFFAPVVLLFEASTPFLKLREVLLASDAAAGPLFAANNLAFSGAFFASRIVFGYARGYAFAVQSEALLAAGGAHSPALVRMYEVLAAGLTALNTFWMWRIVKGAIANEGATTPRAAPKLRA